MLIPAAALEALLASGVTVRPVGSDLVELASADGTDGVAVLRVRRRSAPLSPSHVRAAVRAEQDPALIVAPAASDAALAAVAAAGWSVIVAHGEHGHPRGSIRLPGRDVLIGTEPEQSAPRTPQRGPRPWRTYALVRRMLQSGPVKQVELAREVGVTQPLVSHTLKRLGAVGLVVRTDTVEGPRWVIVDRAALVLWWLDTYPGPGGISTYWYGLTGPVDQARSAVAQLSPAGPVAVSGDVAADLIAPWRRPQRAVVYADPSSGSAPLDLSAAGLTQSHEQEATLELVVPADRSVFAPLPEAYAAQLPPSAQLPLADLLQVAWDLRRAPGADRDQALDALLRLLTADVPLGVGTT